MRERGLKFQCAQGVPRAGKSLPMRERGLKYDKRRRENFGKPVAPHAGAWIEIKDCNVAEGSVNCRSPCGSVD